MKCALLALMTVLAIAGTGCHSLQHAKHSGGGCNQCRSGHHAGIAGHHAGLAANHGGAHHGGAHHGGAHYAGGGGGYYGAHRPGHPDFVPKLPPHYGQQVQQGPPGPPAPSYAYPYYTTRGPRDFFLDNPPSIGR
jgi:hypothetical protein